MCGDAAQVRIEGVNAGLELERAVGRGAARAARCGGSRCAETCEAAVGPIAVLGGILFLIPRALPSWTASEGAWIALVGAGGVCVFGRYIMEQRRVARVLEQRTHELEINEERNRMARDMHDILGHSLTVIALKTELATRLVDAAPDQAKAELTEVQSLARSALADVRAALAELG